MGCTQSTGTVKMNKKLVTFQKYYKSIRLALVTTKFHFDDSSSHMTFQETLLFTNSIDKNAAKVWVDCYVDYMILLGYYQYIKSPLTNIYPPYAIQQVHRLHTTYVDSYDKFCLLVCNFTGACINFDPLRLVTCPGTDANKMIAPHRIHYISARRLLFQNLYNNPKSYKRKTAKREAESVWEDFNSTVLKNELKFCFSTLDEKKVFSDMITINPDVLLLRNNDLNNLKRIAVQVRSLLKLDDFLPYGTVVSEPQRISKSVKTGCDQSLTKMCSKLDGALIDSKFTNLLAWEQRITMRDARQWIVEYKKFLVLAVKFRCQVVPSEKVRKVWHLHMQHTLTFRNDLSNSNYGEPRDWYVYYHPWKSSTGKPTTAAEYSIMYKDTLRMYKDLFIQDRPAEVWPSKSDEFSELNINATFLVLEKDKKKAKMADPLKSTNIEHKIFAQNTDGNGSKQCNNAIDEGLPKANDLSFGNGSDLNYSECYKCNWKGCIDFGEASYVEPVPVTYERPRYRGSVGSAGSGGSF